MYGRRVVSVSSEIDLQRALKETLYIEALLLADASRSYFEGVGCTERESLSSLERVVLSCEALKVTTRIMHVLAWLLTQRAVMNGELRPRDALDPSRRLAMPPVTDHDTTSLLPAETLRLIAASIDLYRRVASLDEVLEEGMAVVSPALLMQQKLGLAFGQ